MELGLEGKLAFVPGGSKGIGLACAQMLATEGARIAICSRNQSNVDAALLSLPESLGFSADLSSEEHARGAVERIEAELGPIDILINSAGAAKQTLPEELTPSAWRVAMDAKYFTYINVIDPVVKLMATRASGVIVNVIGAGGKVASPIHLPGGAANAALMLATVGLAHAYANRGVRIVGVNPGYTETDRVADGISVVARASGISDEQALAEVARQIPLGRMAHPREIASVVAFLCSRQASYVTGSIITMDGACVPCVV